MDVPIDEIFLDLYEQFMNISFEFFVGYPSCRIMEYDIYLSRLKSYFVSLEYFSDCGNLSHFSFFVETSWRIRNSSYFHDYGLPFIYLGAYIAYMINFI